MVNDKKVKGLLVPLSLILAASLAGGALFQLILPVGNYWQGFLQSSMLIFFNSLLLFGAWRAAGKGKALAWMIGLAFVLRIALGLFMAWGLPRFGYPERPQQAGFVFEDAFRREENAWNLAKSDAPIVEAFSDAYETDQYGGMLALSALIYRFLSPDAYRPALLSIIAAGVMALTVPVLTSALRRRFDARTVLWAGWILALYPEGMLLGSAQMREPFFILFFAVLIWAAADLLDGRKLGRAIPLFILGMLGLFLFSYRIAIPVLGALALWAWVDLSARLKPQWLIYAGWIGLALVALGGLWFLRDWLEAVLHWDVLQTVERSGMVQSILDLLPEWADFPFVVIYGFFQPVLPAAIAAPAPWIWQSLGIFRSVGWYALLPLLAYGLVRVWQLPKARKRLWLILMVILVWGWIFIASARAGGDQWDNPRYRAIFLPWMSLIAGWAIHYANKTRDAWLIRILVIEGIFLVHFTAWYLGRYLPQLPRPGIGIMAALVFGLSVLVVGLGLLRDRKRSSQGESAASQD
jgi:hypothetical protein